MAAVLVAATCWSFIGVAYRLILDEYVISPLMVVAVRASTAAVAVMIFVAMRADLRRQLSQVRPRASLIPLLVAGTVSITGFNIALIYAFEVAGVAVGTVLLYFAPSLVAIGAWLGFKHRISRIQRAALVVSLCGIAGVSGMISATGSVPGSGVLLGILAASGYASYSLVGQVLLMKHHPLVIVGVSQAIGAVVAWAVTLTVHGPVLPELTAILWTVGITGLLTTLVPMVLYTWALSRLGPPRASLLTTIEPVIAVGLAFAVLGETLSMIQMAGGALVVGSVVIAATERVRR